MTYEKKETPAPVVTIAPEEQSKLLAEIAEETALATRLDDQDRSLIARLSTSREAATVFERRAQMMDAARVAAIRRTQPEDWVLFKDRQGNVTAMLTASGVGPVAEVYGIGLKNIRPRNDRDEFEPLRIEGEGCYSLRAWADAYSSLNGRQVEAMEATRASSEDFTGRSAIKGAPEIVKDGDLRSSVYTLLLTKAVRILASMIRVPTTVLDEAWKGTGKTTARCRKGSGFGSSSERAAEGVAEEDLASQIEELRCEILARVGGDADAAKQLCRDITKHPTYNPQGYDTPKRITKTGGIRAAWANLRKHPTFGDQKGD